MKYPERIVLILDIFTRSNYFVICITCRITPATFTTGYQPLPEAIMTFWQLGPWEQTKKIVVKIQTFYQSKCLWKYHLQNVVALSRSWYRSKMIKEQQFLLIKGSMYHVNDYSTAFTWPKRCENANDANDILLVKWSRVVANPVLVFQFFIKPWIETFYNCCGISLGYVFNPCLRPVFD